MCAATAKGLFESVEKAQLAMAQGILTQYTPREEYRSIYDKLYLRYKEFCSFLEF
jgi:L-ribulokinase